MFHKKVYQTRIRATTMHQAHIPGMFNQFIGAVFMPSCTSQGQLQWGDSQWRPQNGDAPLGLIAVRPDLYSTSSGKVFPRLKTCKKNTLINVSSKHWVRLLIPVGKALRCIECEALHKPQSSFHTIFCTLVVQTMLNPQLPNIVAMEAFPHLRSRLLGDAHKDCSCHGESIQGGAADKWLFCNL